MSEIYDITIIGGGPVGLFAAFYAHMRKARVKLIDSLPQLGGQPAILYPEKKILDVPAFINLTGEELTNRLIEQLETFETDICLNETAEDIVKKNDLFTIKTNKGQHQSKTIIIAMGGGAFKPRALELEGAEEFDNIHYHVANIQQYADKQVVVLGGGDSAVDWSLAFEKIAPTTIIHRRDNFRALEHSVSELKNSNVSIKTPYVPSKLIGANGHLTHLEISKVKSQETELIPLDHLFVNYGFKSSVGNLKNWGLELNRHKIIVNSKQESSLVGIYAIGDCCSYEGKVDLIATGLGEAPTAVNNAMNYIYPDQKVQPKHSTSL
ncbi:NAD(P)/FAD-dependent oxidoreductase [Streptococcus massiliensis]|uniref:Ferredoxin--NADP reductase n=1 Tax=Streptococcus massiliensis TaxID=313439 RepID=A0A380KVY4_9STRE|nr:NAD(P)/FAD-dependent oxidoreductase [Streptococcus massiliensis]SUN76082.1 thioredoxin-disulfide reductase [Streptococcus massiliensis]